MLGAQSRPRHCSCWFCLLAGGWHLDEEAVSVQWGRCFSGIRFGLLKRRDTWSSWRVKGGFPREAGV